MRLCTSLLGLLMVCLLAVQATAQTQTPTKKHPLRAEFQKLDTNKDGIVTQAEFVAGHPKLGATKATARYTALSGLGGTTTVGSETGMTLEQFRKGHKLWRQAHPKKSTT